MAAGNRYKNIENYQTLVRDDKIKLYQWLFKHTKNEAKDVVVSKGIDMIEQIMGGDDLYKPKGVKLGIDNIS